MRELAYPFPADWDAKTVGDIACHVGSGATPTGGSSVYSKTGITFIRSQNVTFKGLLLDDVAFIEPRIHQQMARSEIFPHDVLLNITGASIGRGCFVPHGFGIANVNQHVCAIRLPQPSHEDAVFLAGVLASHIGQSQIDRLNAGGNREGLNYQQVRSFSVPWPMPEERKRIAAILEAVDETIAKTEAVIAKLKQVRAGLLHDLLTRGLNEHGQLRDPLAHPEQFQDSPLGRIPLEWEVQSLESVTDPSTPICYGIVQAMEFVPDGVPVLTIRDLLGDYSTGLHRTARNIDANYARSRVRPDDVLISVKGTIGRVAVVPQHFQGNISRDLARVRPNNRVRARFLVHLLRSPRGQRILEQAQVGTTRAELSIAPLKRLSFAFPLPTEQERIAMVLDEHDALIRSHEHEFERLGQLKSGLMTDLLTGRVRVPEHFGVRRHDAALSSRAHEPASGPLRPETAHESGDTSPHSKDTSPHSKGDTP